MRPLSLIVECFARAPWWLAFALAALVLPAAVLCRAFKKRGLYAPACLAVGGVSFALLAAQNAQAALLFGGLYAALCPSLWGVCALFRGKLKKGGKRDALYEKYRPELAPPAPPKVLCYDDAPRAFENDMRLDHAAELLKKLSKCRLTPADRLETDVIARSFERLKGKPLGEDEVRSLNDALSSVLKLTAKYKL